MSDANRTKLAYVREATFAVTPASPRFRELRITGTGLGARPLTTVSSELRADRQVTDVIRTGVEAGGDIPTEVSYGNTDDLIESVLAGAWALNPVRDNDGTADTQITDVAVGTGVYTMLASAGTPVNSGTFAVGHLVKASGFTNAANNQTARATAGGATSVTLGATTVAEPAPPATARLKAIGFEGASGDLVAVADGITSTALNFTTLGLTVGMWLKIGGNAVGQQYATAALNGLVRVSVIAATKLTFDRLPTGWTTDAGAGKTIRVFTSDIVKNGVVKHSYSVEQQYQDLDVPEFDYFTGQRVGSMTLDVGLQGILTASFGMVGADAVTGQTSRKAGATDVLAPTNDVMNTSSNIGTLSENGAAIIGPNYVTAVSVSVDNGLRRRNAVGRLTAADVAYSRANITGRLTTYFGSSALRNKVLNGTASGFDFPIVDPDGTRAYVFDFPRIKYTEGSPENIALDQDRTVPLSFQALRHATLGYSMSVNRFEVYAA
jgi:tail tube protein